MSVQQHKAEATPPRVDVAGLNVTGAPDVTVVLAEQPAPTPAVVGAVEPLPDKSPLAGMVSPETQLTGRLVQIGRKKPARVESVHTVGGHLMVQIDGYLQHASNITKLVD